MLVLPPQDRALERQSTTPLGMKHVDMMRTLDVEYCRAGLGILLDDTRWKGEERYTDYRTRIR